MEKEKTHEQTTKKKKKKNLQRCRLHCQYWFSMLHACEWARLCWFISPTPSQPLNGKEGCRALASQAIAAALLRS
jgi:hypothetical protein